MVCTVNSTNDMDKRASGAFCWWRLFFSLSVSILHNRSCFKRETDTQRAVRYLMLPCPSRGYFAHALLGALIRAVVAFSYYYFSTSFTAASFLARWGEL